MFGLYIHIPFCEKKCKYCSFHVQSLEATHTHHQTVLDWYVHTLRQELLFWSKTLNDKNIRTIHIWWWTPSTIWATHLIDLIETIDSLFCLEYLEELTVELNPHPQEEILWLIKTCNKAWKKFLKVRRSIGIQSLDSSVLRDAWRDYTFPGVVDFLRNLVPLKQPNNSFCFDFMAFGKKHTSKKWQSMFWKPGAQKFFEQFVHSYFADGFSLYTLELFEWSERFEKYKHNTNYQKDGYGLKAMGEDDDIYEEFQNIKEVLQHAWYIRYEISNFSLWGKNSIHNRSYRSQDCYIWLWSHASSFWHAWHQDFVAIGSVLTHTQQTPLDAQSDETPSTQDTAVWYRWTNSKHISKFFEQKTNDVSSTITNHIEKDSIDVLDFQAYLIEALFLWLRTSQWVCVHTKKLSDPVKDMYYNHVDTSIFVKNRQDIITLCVDQWHMTQDQSDQDDQFYITLTDTWMDIYNHIISELLESI